MIRTISSNARFTSIPPTVRGWITPWVSKARYAQVLEEYVGTQLQRTYTLGQDVLTQANTTAVSTGAAVHHLLYDGHGSTRAILTASLAFVQKFAYEAYGTMLSSAQLANATTALTHLLYSGEWTNASGLQWLRDRWMQPSIGRFTQMDRYTGRTADPQSLHKYLYAYSNPVTLSDPSGFDFSIIGTNFRLAIGLGIVAGFLGIYAGIKGVYSNIATSMTSSGHIYQTMDLVINQALVDGVIDRSEASQYKAEARILAATYHSTFKNYNNDPRSWGQRNLLLGAQNYYNTDVKGGWLCYHWATFVTAALDNQNKITPFRNWSYQQVGHINENGGLAHNWVELSIKGNANYKVYFDAWSDAGLFGAPTARLDAPLLANWRQELFTITPSGIPEQIGYYNGALWHYNTMNWNKVEAYIPSSHNSKLNIP